MYTAPPRTNTPTLLYSSALAASGRPLACTWHGLSLCACRRPPRLDLRTPPLPSRTCKSLPARPASCAQHSGRGLRLLPRLDKDIKFIVTHAELSLFLVTQPPLTGGGLELHTRTATLISAAATPSTLLQGPPQPRRTSTLAELHHLGKDAFGSHQPTPPPPDPCTPVPQLHALPICSPTSRHTSWEARWAHSCPPGPPLGAAWEFPSSRHLCRPHRPFLLRPLHHRSPSHSSKEG